MREREGGKEKEGWIREEMGVWVHTCTPAHNAILCMTYNVHNTCLYQDN